MTAQEIADQLEALTVRRMVALRDFNAMIRGVARQDEARSRLELALRLSDPSPRGDRG